jgi:DNA-binding MarR family transcriptional regulator
VVELPLLGHPDHEADPAAFEQAHLRRRVEKVAYPQGIAVEGDGARQVAGVDGNLLDGSGPRASALSVLVFRGPQSLGELAAAEGVKPPTMSRLVKAMQAEGLVETRTTTHDQRQIRIQASARGRQLMLRGRQRRLDAIARLLQDASPAEVKALGTVVRLLERSLK